MKIFTLRPYARNIAGIFALTFARVAPAPASRPRPARGEKTRDGQPISSPSRYNMRFTDSLCYANARHVSPMTSTSPGFSDGARMPPGAPEGSDGRFVAGAGFENEGVRLAFGGA